MYKPAPIDNKNDTVANNLGIPKDNNIGSTITPIATTAPAPNILENTAVVTTAKSVDVTIGLSPPSSTVLRIIVAAIPVSNMILPNQAPNMKFISTPPHPSGPPWNTFLRASTILILTMSLFCAIKSGFVTKALPIRVIQSI